ncbi:MAG: hypothetical protein QG652_959 [Pseudomonadota bacterium]|nr:hypothetical protein [Pseudomonadota bacterium]
MKIKCLLMSFCVLCSYMGAVNAEAFSPANGHFVLSANVIADSISDDVPDVPVMDVDDGSYLFRVAYEWPSDIKDIFGVSKSSQEYYSLAFVKSVVDMEDDYVESVSSIAVIYGRKYFLNSTQHEGFAIGWYAGASTWSADGYEYYNTINYGAYTEDGVSVLAAAEVRYDAYINLQGSTSVAIYPSLGVTVNTQTGEVEFFPTLMAGLKF